MAVVKKPKTDEERAVEQLRNLVEEQLQDWAGAPLPHQAAQASEEDGATILTFPVLLEEDKGEAKVARVAGHADADMGVRYQRCGGGRRVIRKTNGGE